MPRISVSKKEIGKKFGLEWDLEKDGRIKIDAIDINLPIFNIRSNCRGFDSERTRKILDCIKDGGYIGNICITKIGNEIVNGHHLIEACKILRKPTVSVATILNKNPEIEEDVWKLACFSFSLNRANQEEGMTKEEIDKFIVRGYKRYNEIFGFNSGNLADKWNIKSLSFDLGLSENTIMQYKSNYDKLIKEKEIIEANIKFNIDNKSEIEEAKKQKDEKVANSPKDMSELELALAKANGLLLEPTPEPTPEPIIDVKGGKDGTKKQSLGEKINTWCSKLIGKGLDVNGARRKEDVFAEGANSIINAYRNSHSDTNFRKELNNFNKQMIPSVVAKFKHHRRLMSEVEEILRIEPDKE